MLTNGENIYIFSHILMKVAHFMYFWEKVFVLTEAHIIPIIDQEIIKIAKEISSIILRI